MYVWMYDRRIDLRLFAKERSLFLLGPRQTGKSTLLRHLFPDALYIDLLTSEVFRQFSSAPETLRHAINDHQLVVIDEIQKLPNLLDEVQHLIDTRGTRFLLTGSSARKLRRGRANLLGGRAFFLSLHSLVSTEIGFERIDELLQRGGLPGIVDSPLSWEALKAYTGTYLREEIQAEALTRSIGNFARFLDVAAHFNGAQINYTKIGRDSEVPPRTVRDFVGILQDTLILHVLPPFRASPTRKLTATDKVYFFDIGVANALCGRRSLHQGSAEYGTALEQLVFLELRAAIDYLRLDTRLAYWRTLTGVEVDFLVGDELAIEVKSTRRVGPSDLRSLRAIGKDLTLRQRLLVCREPYQRRTEDGIDIMPVQTFCKRLWQGALLVP